MRAGDERQKEKQVQVGFQVGGDENTAANEKRVDKNQEGVKLWGVELRDDLLREKQNSQRINQSKCNKGGLLFCVFVAGVDVKTGPDRDDARQTRQRQKGFETGAGTNT
jgi:hypothetical protein